MKRCLIRNLGLSRNTDSLAAHGYNCAIGKRRRMALEQSAHDLDPLVRWDIGESDEAGVSHATDKHQRSEVLVHCHKNSLLRRCPFEQGLIAWIGTAIARLENIMLFLAQPIGESLADAAVDHELH
jgi:hypothetical protein